jgi:transcriptional regulator with XRE-family HTH domain
MVYGDVGKKIQQAREDAGLSQEELASMLGITQSALSNYELGKRRLHLANLQEIARNLNKPLACFLELDDGSAEMEPAGGEDDEVTGEIMQLVSELPPEEKLFILEYVRWRKDRLEGRE